MRLEPRRRTAIRPSPAERSCTPRNAASTARIARRPPKRNACACLRRPPYNPGVRLPTASFSGCPFQNPPIWSDGRTRQTAVEPSPLLYGTATQGRAVSAKTSITVRAKPAGNQPWHRVFRGRFPGFMRHTGTGQSLPGPPAHPRSGHRGENSRASRTKTPGRDVPTVENANVASGSLCKDSGKYRTRNDEQRTLHEKDSPPKGQEVGCRQNRSYPVPARTAGIRPVPFQLSLRFDPA